MPEPSREVLVPQPFSWAIDAGLSYLAYRLLRYAVARRLSMRTVATLEVIDAPGGASVGGRSVLPAGGPPVGPALPELRAALDRIPAALTQLSQAVDAQIAASIARAPTVVQTAPGAPTLLPPQPGNPVQAFGPRAVGQTPGGAGTIWAGGGPTQVIAPPAPPEAAVLPTVTQLPRGARTQLAGAGRPTVLGPTPPPPPPVDLGEGMGFPEPGGGRPPGSPPALSPLPMAGIYDLRAALPYGTFGQAPGGAAPRGLPLLASESWPSATATVPLQPGVLPPARAMAALPGELGAFGFALPGAAGGADWTAAPLPAAFAFPGPFPASPPTPAFALFPVGQGLFSQGGPAGGGTGAVGGQPGRVVLPPRLIR